MKPATSAGRLIDWVVVAGACVMAAFVAVLGVFFLPLHWGPVPLPVSVLGAVAVLAVLPRVCHRLTGSLAAALTPAVIWFLVTAWLVLKRNSLYQQLPLAVQDWRLLLLTGLGGLSGALAIGRIWGDPVAAGTPRRSSAAPDGSGRSAARPVGGLPPPTSGDHPAASSAAGRTDGSP